MTRKHLALAWAVFLSLLLYSSMAAALEIDAVIDPADTRRWIVGGLDAAAGVSKPWSVRVDSF